MSSHVSDAVQAPTSGPVQRVINTFVAPSKAFESVRQLSDWWIPFLIAAAVGVLYGFVLLHHVGLATLVDGVIRDSPKLTDQIASATPAVANKIRAQIGSPYKGYYLFPIGTILFGLISAGALLAASNFGAGGNATYKQMVGVWFYGTLPLTVFALLVIAAIYGGVTGDSFNVKNPIGTNVGFYLEGFDLPRVLMPLLSAIDLFAIWTAVLLTIGVSTVSGIKRGAAAVVVFGWWFIVILGKTAFAALGF